MFYYCRTYYKAVRVGGGGEWRTCAVRDDEPRPVWMRLPITHYGWVSEVVGKQRRANLEKEETESEDEYC